MLYIALYFVLAVHSPVKDLAAASLQSWAGHLAKIEDLDIKREFFHIQQQFAEIIYEDVLKKRGEFFGGETPSNRDIDTAVELQGDNRTFMTMTKTGFINVPGPSQKS